MAVAKCPADKCMWDTATAKCKNKHTTQPAQPSDHCQAIAAASDCTPDKKCTFENNKCRMMTTEEAIKKEWEKILSYSSLPLTSTTITVEKINKYLAQSDPFNTELNVKHVDTGDTNKDKKISWKEYDDYSGYMHERMGEEGRKSKCVLSFNKWQTESDDARKGLWTKCAAIKVETECKVECEPDHEFKPSADWKQLQEKAGIVSTAADQRIPRDIWIKHSAELFKETPARMGTFFEEADRNQDKFADEAEFSDFASYLRNVGSWGCTISKSTYDKTVKKNSEGRDEPDKTGKFN